MWDPIGAKNGERKRKQKRNGFEAIGGVGLRRMAA